MAFQLICCCHFLGLFGIAVASGGPYQQYDYDQDRSYRPQWYDNGNDGVLTRESNNGYRSALSDQLTNGGTGPDFDETTPPIVKEAYEDIIRIWENTKENTDNDIYEKVSKLLITEKYAERHWFFAMHIGRSFDYHTVI